MNNWIFDRCKRCNHSRSIAATLNLVHYALSTFLNSLIVTYYKNLKIWIILDTTERTPKSRIILKQFSWHKIFLTRTAYNSILSASLHLHGTLLVFAHIWHFYLSSLVCCSVPTRGKMTLLYGKGISRYLVSSSLFLVIFIIQPATFFENIKDVLNIYVRGFFIRVAFW